MSLRTFVATVPTAEGRDAIAEATVALRTDLGALGFRAVAAESYHVTLRFLGNVEIAEVEALRALLAPLAENATSIACRCARVRGLPNPHRPRVVALELDSEGALDALGRAVHERLRARFGTADQPFLPHLTVLRSNGTIHLPDALPTLDVRFELEGIGLYRSDTHPRGARYTRLG